MDRYTANIIDDGHGNIYLQYDKNKDGQWYAASDVTELARHFLEIFNQFPIHIFYILPTQEQTKKFMEQINKLIAELEPIAEANNKKLADDSE